MEKYSTTWINCKLLKILSTSISLSHVYRLSFFLDILLLFSRHFALFWTTLRWHLFLSWTGRGDIIIHGYYILDDDHNHFYFLFLYIYGYLTWYWIHTYYLWTYLIILNENSYMSECGYSCENSFEIYGDSWRYCVHLMVSYKCN